MNEQKELGLGQLVQERAKFLLDQISDVIPALKELQGITNETRQDVERQVAEFALSIKTSKLDRDQLEAFFKKPYYLEPVHGRPDSWYLVIPKFVDIQIGWLDRSTESFNVFLINRYMDWLGEIPEAIKKQLDWKPPPELVLDGEELHGPKGALEYAWQKYRPFLHDRDENKIKINPKRAFDLITSMIKDGVLPFTIKPVDKADIVERKCDFQLREYQQHAWNEFLRFSAIGVFIPPGTGKTIIALWVMTHLKGPHLVVVPTKLLQEQWIERIQVHTDLQPSEYEVLTYQSAISKASTKTWTTLLIDECLPYDAEVITEFGALKIGDIVENYWLNPRILSLNSEGRLELKPLVNRFKKDTVEFVEVETEAGRNLRLTSTHQVYLDVRGNHLPARKLKEGMPLVSLRNLWKGVSKSLFSECPQNASQTSKSQQNYRPEFPLEQTMPRKMATVQGTFVQGENARRESLLEGWKPHEYLATNSVLRLQTTEMLHDLQGEIEAENIGRTSQGRQSSEQYEGEHYGSMSELSRKLTQRRRSYSVEVDYVKRIRRAKVKTTTVYDIEVADNHNFFANNLLVSNCQHIPANSFVKLSLIRRKYTIGLSGSPMREDGREEYIFALTGKPVGLSWDYFKKLNLIKSPTCHVWIVKNFEAKLRRLASLLQEDLRTIIFSDSLETGKAVAGRFKIPFAYGATKDNMATILENRVVVVSRVGDEGMSLPDIERVIEVSWLFGSRRQELQRTTRLLHSEQGAQESHILMTLEEYLHDRKRLFSIMDKGFKIVLHREGVSEKVIEDHSHDYRPLLRTRNSRSKLSPEPTIPVPVMLGQSGTFTSLPGVQKMMALMNKKQKQLYTLLLDHDGEWFSSRRLPLLLGYASDSGLRQGIDFSRMVEKGWIEQKAEETGHLGRPRLSYRTNMKGKLGGS